MIGCGTVLMIIGIGGVAAALLMPSNKAAIGLGVVSVVYLVPGILLFRWGIQKNRRTASARPHLTDRAPATDEAVVEQLLSLFMDNPPPYIPDDVRTQIREIGKGLNQRGGITAMDYVYARFCDAAQRSLESIPKHADIKADRRRGLMSADIVLSDIWKGVGAWGSRR